jgi:hypothetical protein
LRGNSAAVTEYPKHTASGGTGPMHLAQKQIIVKHAMQNKMAQATSENMNGR